jgi:hypothetical protein
VQLDVRAARRRLLAATVAVDATINLPDAAAAGRAKAALTADAIGAAVKAAGLPPATITSMPVVSTSPAARLGPGPVPAAMAAAAAAALGLAAAVVV